MIITNNKLKKLRFEMSSQPMLLEKLKNKKEIKYGIGKEEKGEKYFIMITMKAYSLNLENNEEVFGYLGEVNNVINKTSFELDKFALIVYINSVVSDLEEYLNENMPIYPKMEFEKFDTNKYVAEILNILTSMAWY